MKEKLFGSLPLAACRLTLVARGLPLVACGLLLVARNRLSLGALNKALAVLCVKSRTINRKVFGYEGLLSAGHRLHS